VRSSRGSCALWTASGLARRLGLLPSHAWPHWRMVSEWTSSMKRFLCGWVALGVLLLLFAVPGCSYLCHVEVRGRVREAATGQPIPNARVRLLDAMGRQLAEPVSTNQQGEFQVAFKTSPSLGLGDVELTECQATRLRRTTPRPGCRTPAHSSPVQKDLTKRRRSFPVRFVDPAGYPLG
jgi:hypothetical protein